MLGSSLSTANKKEMNKAPASKNTSKAATMSLNQHNIEALIKKVRNNPKAMTKNDSVILKKALGMHGFKKLINDARLQKTTKKINNKTSNENKVLQKKSIATQSMHDTQSNAQDNKILREKTADKTKLPENIKAVVKNMSGYSLDNVNVHYNSDKPEQVGALAYTQGTDIHVAPGQEKHLPHEAWHVVQQAQGRVQPTMQLKGVSLNDNAHLEREATEMGQKSLSQAYSSKAPEAAKIIPKAINTTVTTPIQRKVYLGGNEASLDSPILISIMLKIHDPDLKNSILVKIADWIKSPDEIRQSVIPGKPFKQFTNYKSLVLAAKQAVLMDKYSKTTIEPVKGKISTFLAEKNIEEENDEEIMDVENAFEFEEEPEEPITTQGKLNRSASIALGKNAAYTYIRNNIDVYDIKSDTFQGTMGGPGRFVLGTGNASSYNELLNGLKGIDEKEQATVIFNSLIHGASIPDKYIDEQRKIFSKIISIVLSAEVTRSSINPVAICAYLNQVMGGKCTIYEAFENVIFGGIGGSELSQFHRRATPEDQMVIEEKAKVKGTKQAIIEWANLNGIMKDKEINDWVTALTAQILDNAKKIVSITPRKSEVLKSD